MGQVRWTSGQLAFWIRVGPHANGGPLPHFARVRRKGRPRHFIYGRCFVPGRALYPIAGHCARDLRGWQFVVMQGFQRKEANGALLEEAAGARPWILTGPT